MSDPGSPSGDTNHFDSKAYLRQKIAERTAREQELRRQQRAPYVSIGIRTVLSLLCTPLVVFGGYALRWSQVVPSIDVVGLEQARAWPWIVGSLVITAYSAFYGIAVGLGTRGHDESRRVAIGSFYGFWIWLPLFLIYPGTRRLGISSDDRVLWVFVLVALGQTIFAWSMARWSQHYIEERAPSV